MILVFFCLTAGGQRADTWRWKIRPGVGLDIRPSYAFSSYRDDIMREIMNMDDIKKTHFATSLHLKLGFTFSEGAYVRNYPASWQGIGAGINFLGNSRGLGNPVAVYLFQGAPVWRLSDNLSVYYEWNFGASFGWRPCDTETALSNLITGSKVNAYINLGAGLRWRLGSHYHLSAGLDLTHFSNGNTTFPNPGINMAGIRIGVTRSFGRENKKKPVVPDTLSLKRKPEFDVTLYGTWRKRVYRGGENPVLLNGKFGVCGIDLSPMWRVSEIFRAGVSADFQWDESTDLKRNHASGTTSDDILFYRPSFIRQICAGLSGRAELVMPLFSVNVGIGYNVIGPEETRATYQLANLKVRVTDRFFLNIGYQLLDFRKQNNLMLGVGYSFR